MTPDDTRVADLLLPGRDLDPPRFIEDADAGNRPLVLDFRYNLADSVVFAAGHVGNDAVANGFDEQPAVFIGHFGQHGLLGLEVVPGGQADGNQQNNCRQTEEFDFQGGH